MEAVSTPVAAAVQTPAHAVLDTPVQGFQPCVGQLLVGTILQAQLVPRMPQDRIMELSVHQLDNLLECNVVGHEHQGPTGLRCQAAGTPVILEWLNGRLFVAMYDVDQAQVGEAKLTTASDTSGRVEVYQQCAFTHYRWENFNDYASVETALVDPRHNKPDLRVRVHVARQGLLVEAQGYGIVCRMSNTGRRLVAGAYSGRELKLMRYFEEFAGLRRKPAYQG